MIGDGFLAIWSDIAAAQETDYLHWLTREHTTERLQVEGFLGVRVYRSLQPDVRRYFIRYELQSPLVLASDDYLARLNAPSPWSERIMPLLENFVRGGGRVVSRSGVGQGSFLAAIKYDSLAQAPAANVVDEALQNDRIVAAELLETDSAKTSIETQERTMRSRDRSFGGLFLLEGLDIASVSTAVAELIRTPTPEMFMQVFALRLGR